MSRAVISTYASPDEALSGEPDHAITGPVGELIEGGVKERGGVAGERGERPWQRTHSVYRNGGRTITDGPFTEAKELVAVSR